MRAGDIVRLATGGPKMTVENIDLSGNATCCWFDDPSPFFYPEMNRIEVKADALVYVEKEGK